MNNLKNEYFYKEDNTLDAFVTYLDCNTLPLYYILKNRIKNIGKPFEVFLQDISFCLQLASKSKFNDLLVSPDYKINDEVFKVAYRYEGRGEEAADNLWKVLGQDDNMVVVHTYVDRLPFSLDFKSFDTLENVEKSFHFFLAVGCDEKNLYYVDMHENINPKYFSPHPENHCVGVIDKELLKPAFDIFMNFLLINIDTKALLFYNKFDEVCSSFIKYHEKVETKEDKMVYLYGINALKKLEEFSLNECIMLDEINEVHNKSTGFVLGWKIYNITAVRKLFKGYTEKNINKSKYFESLQKVVQQNIFCMEDMKRHMDKAMLNGNFVFGNEYTSFIRDLIDQEKNIQDIILKMKSK